MLDTAILIGIGSSVRETLVQLNKTAKKVLFVVDNENRLLGSVTDGDVRRALLRDVSIDSQIDNVYNNNPVAVIIHSYTDNEIKELFKANKIDAIPIVDEARKVIDVAYWDEHFLEHDVSEYSGPPLGIPVVVMAGGKGTRLSPFTNVLPKPLIPIGDKTILELIMGEFTRYGVDRFIFTLNYRGEMIRAYFEGIEKKHSISYIWEDDYYGTAGSLSLAATELGSTFIVTNCDIIVKANYADVLDFHRNSGAVLTIVSSLQHHKIPYGVVEFKPGGEVTKIQEKPEFIFPINTGVYILDTCCLDYIPPKKVFHMTHLIEALIETGKKVVTYPVNEEEYIDIGQWEEYRRVVSQFPIGQ